MYENILVSVEGKVGLVTINRPEFSNAFARESYTEIAQAFQELEANPQVGAIAITGAGKHFSAGGDIRHFKVLIETGEYLDPQKVGTAGNMSKAIRRCSKPTIAMVNGVATGAGLSCALACDYRVVAPSSKLIMGFINMGLSGDTGSIYMLLKLLGPERATLMMNLGEPVKGEEAVKMGLATLLAEEGKLTETAMAFANKLASKATNAIAAQKAIVNKYVYGDYDEYSIDEQNFIAECSRNPNFAEAVYAFLDKRTPEFNKN